MPLVFKGISTGYARDGIVLELDKNQLREMKLWFKMFPREMSKETKKEWQKEAKPMVRAIRTISYSGRGANSLGKGPGLRTDQGQGGQKRRHVKMDLKWRSKFMYKKERAFGGYTRIGFSGRKKNSAQYIAFFHEYGTKHNQARAPLATGWKIVRGQADIERASDRAIDNVLKSKGYSR